MWDAPEKESAFEPMVTTGLAFLYDITYHISGKLSCTYSHLFEKDDDMQFISFTAGCTYWF